MEPSKRLLVHYSFLAGHLVLTLENGQCLQIAFNGAGVAVAAAKTETKLGQLEDLIAPKPEFKQFNGFLREEGIYGDQRHSPFVHPGMRNPTNPELLSQRDAQNVVLGGVHTQQARFLYGVHFGLID